jgi:hypothetical protein
MAAMLLRDDPEGVASEYVKYYRDQVSHYPRRKEWKTCLALAERLLAIAEATPPDVEELQKLYHDLARQEAWGSGWEDMRLQVAAWLRSLGRGDEL